jgi:hypothetical protein
LPTSEEEEDMLVFELFLIFEKQGRKPDDLDFFSV